MIKKVSTQDLINAGTFVFVNQVHLSNDTSMNSKDKKAFQRHLEVLDYLINTELDSRIRAEKH